MTGRCTRWERWLPGSGGRLKVLNWNLHSFQLLEIIQVLDSISWVRCASGNVKKMRLFFFDSPERPLRYLDNHNQRTHFESPPKFFRPARPNNPGRKFARRGVVETRTTPQSPLAWNPDALILAWMDSSGGNFFKIIFRASAERVQALPINLRYISKRVFQ